MPVRLEDLSEDLSILSCAHHLKTKENPVFGQAGNYEIELIVRDGNYSLNKWKSIRLSKGHILLRSPEEKYFSTVEESYLVAFDIGNRPKKNNSAPEVSVCGIPFPFDTSERFLDYYILFRESYYLYNGNRWMNRYAVKANLLRIIYYILCDMTEAHKKDGVSAKNKILIEQVKQYMRDNYTKSVTLDELCEQVMLSPSHLGRLFKKATNKTPLEYMIELKLNAAREKLLTTTLSIKEISYDCGFDNISYFCTLFKKKLNITPQEYRFKNLPV